MELILTPEIQEMIQYELDSGRYETPEQVLINALVQLKERYWEPDIPLAEFQAMIDKGWDEAERGETVSAEEARAYIAKVRAELNGS